ncbi:class I SAM-dependent methyltransferase [Clostridium formicaceticum]|uniref:Demethylmenaquinone methyltransferase n=1 Tax=Clostridium formicaceticum TaxID=1497 RepID=A0AAC9RMK4_9CLOT|nr:class I SAM-dependent methyltransferase [Clostridium formicaceticum]AOY77765.1 methyltransferase type 11 [Clostridium formicaceticum]ARE88367.1 Demethylmenaquinone methyltransferase [Clostridium formicaceticum]
MDINTEKIRKRYDRVACFYDYLEKPMEKMALGKWRKPLFQEMKGKVLEIGVGTGKNIAYYHDAIEVTAIDFSSKMLLRARKRAETLGKNVALREMDAQDMSFASNTFDYVVATCVFCSVPDPVKGFREIRRVLKPTGKVLLIEHVRSEEKVLGFLMDIMNPLVVNFYGANINRRTEGNIEKSGFDQIKVTNLWRDIVKKIEITN